MPWEYKKMEGAGGGASGRVEHDRFIFLPSFFTLIPCGSLSLPHVLQQDFIYTSTSAL